MRTRRILLLSLLVVVLMLAAHTAMAIPVDGRLDVAYGPALSIQTTQTNFLDVNPFPANGEAYGSELDQAYGYIGDGALHLLLAGNIGICCPNKYSHQEWLEIFFDTQPGGQNTLRSDNALSGYLNYLAGLTFDSGFAPDVYLEVSYNTSSWYATMPTGGGGTGYFLGSNSAGAPGTLIGGTNPYGITAATDDSNATGVTHGCGAASGAGVETGVEMVIPLAALGNPDGCIRVSAFLIGPNLGSLDVGNQVLGPVPPGICALGPGSGVNFATIPGDQFFTICPGIVPVRRATWGQVKTLYR
jgi:hypothetical protein